MPSPASGWHRQTPTTSTVERAGHLDDLTPRSHEVLCPVGTPGPGHLRPVRRRAMAKVCGFAVDWSTRSPIVSRTRQESHVAS